MNHPMSRRQLLVGGACGAAGLLIGNWPTWAAAAPNAAPATSTIAGTAKSVIQIWMWGGPSHVDTFDPKPDAGSDFSGPLNHPIGTSVPGMQIGELLPLLAKQADKFSLVRSLTHGSNAHETAAYMVQTGRMPGDGIVYPCVGAVISHFNGQGDAYKSLIPPYIVLTELQGRFSEAGFLGSRCKPFATGGDPAAARFNVEGVVAPGISDQRQRDRRQLLRKLDTLGAAMHGCDELAALEQCEQRAYDLILGDAGKVFDLAQEKPELRERYGKNTFGQSCLMARRLVERGVPYITINYKGWDTHKQHFQVMRRKLPELDQGLSALLSDLSDRGLLDSTVIWCCGEFGRTPKVLWEAPWNGGRGHYGAVFSALVAGGGFKGGHVLGSSDAKGEAVRDHPVAVADLIGTIYRQMGIDPAGTLLHPQGKQIPIIAPLSSGATPGAALNEIIA
jgi:hypothetical protein